MGLGFRVFGFHVSGFMVMGSDVGLRPLGA